MFSDKQIKALRPTGKKYRVFEKASDKGFGVQVSASGVVSFFQYYRYQGKQRFMTLGRYPNTTLAAAREAARKAYQIIDAGDDPQYERDKEQELKLRKQKAEIEARKALDSLGTVSQMFECYTGQLEYDGKRSVNQVKRIFKADIQPMIGQMKANAVTSDDIRGVLHPITDRDALVLANRCRSYLMAAFKFGIEWDYDSKNYKSDLRFKITVNPVRDVPRPLKSEAPAERVLSESELHLLWSLWGDPTAVPLSVGNVLRLILATGGQRVEEVLHSSWSEFNLSEQLWELPASRTKSGRPHVVPLSDLAIEVLEAQRRLQGDSKRLFPMRGDSTQSMQTNSLGNALRRFCKRNEVRRFTARDLRRTVKTLMGKIGIGKDIRDRLQNHAMTDVSSKHYDRYDYLKEKTNALNVWTQFLGVIIDGDHEEKNVITFSEKFR